MTLKSLMTAAALSCTLLAAPAFAQSSATKAEDYAKDKVVEEAKDTAKDASKDAMKEGADKMSSPKDAMVVKGDSVTHSADDAVVIKGAPLTIETSDQIMTVKNGKMIAKDENIMVTGSEIKTMPTSSPAPVPAQIDIACPSGTTAQADGTCMITGDYRE